MAEPNLKQLADKDFNPEKYVRELSQKCVGGQELQRLRKQIQAQSEKTSVTLKKNVYQNYMQYIDTAKEIAHLETEMYQLSHILSEQRSLLSALSETALLADETPTILEDSSANKENSEEDEKESHKRKLASILEKVDGCTELLNVPGRYLIYDGDLCEIDPLDSSPMHRVHGYLFSDGFMLAIFSKDKRGPKRHEFQVFYELGSLAVVNVRDLGPVKLAFKILAFPDTRVFQCTSTSSKKDWLAHFDQAKRARLAQDNMKRESLSERSPSRAMSVDSPSYHNPFDEVDEDEAAPHPDWFLEAPEDVDVFIAQRHFEDALALLSRAHEYAAGQPPDAVLHDIGRKVDARRRTLTETLMRELEVTPDKSLQGGLRAPRRAVRILNELGRSAQACDLFLQLCSSILRVQWRRVKRDGATRVYVRSLSSAVFSNLCHMVQEFLRAFPHSASCACAFVVWAGGEVAALTAHLARQVLMPGASLSELADCVSILRAQCDRLCRHGVDLRYQVDGALRHHLNRALRDARHKITEALKLHAADDDWTPRNLHSKQKLARCLQEFSELGLHLDAYVTGECWLRLTRVTTYFARTNLQLLDDCLSLQTPELLHTVDETLYDVLKAQLRYVEASVAADAQLDARTRQLKLQNGQFLLGTLLPLIEDKYERALGFRCAMLARLHAEHAALESGTAPSTKHVTKYCSTEYL